MCHATTKPVGTVISASTVVALVHTSDKCTNRPNDNREEPRITPRDLQDGKTGNTGNNDFFNQYHGAHHQTRFDKRCNRQYSPNYNNYQSSPLGSIPGQDLSAILIEQANIQSRSLEMMAASKRKSAGGLPQAD